MHYATQAGKLSVGCQKISDKERCRCYFDFYAEHCWRNKDKLISDVLQWTPSYGWAKVGRPARTYLQYLCANTGCSLEDLPGANDNRDEWWERVREISASNTTWWCNLDNNWPIITCTYKDSLKSTKMGNAVLSYGWKRDKQMISWEYITVISVFCNHWNFCICLHLLFRSFIYEHWMINIKQINKPEIFGPIEENYQKHMK